MKTMPKIELTEEERNNYTAEEIAAMESDDDGDDNDVIDPRNGTVTKADGSVEKIVTEENKTFDDLPAEIDAKKAKPNKAPDHSDDDNGDKSNTGADADTGAAKGGMSDAAIESADESGVVYSEQELAQPVHKPQNLMTPKQIEASRLEFDKRLTENDDKFENGDISNAEYKRIERNLTRELNNLDARETEYHNYQASWDTACTDFIRKHGDVFNNKDGANRKPVIAAFNQYVIEQTAASEKDGYAPSTRDLQIAFNKFATESGYVTGAKRAAAVAEADKLQKKPQSKVPAKTLANTPAADITDTDAGLFGQLDRMDEDAKAEALDRLAVQNPALYEQYMNNE